MPFGAMLDVALGLMFVYLMLALFASAVQEAVASVLKLRSKQLYDGVWRMLSANKAPSDRTSPRRLTTPAAGAAAALAPGAPTYATPQDFFNAVWGHELIKGLSQEQHGPSYLPSRAFCAALVDVLRNGSQAAPAVAIEQSIQALPAGAAKQALSAIFVDAGGDLDRFRDGVSAWFDDAMDRVTGVYKRNAQTLTFVLGLATAAFLNVSTLDVAATLWRDPVARNAIAEDAARWAKQNPTLPAAGASSPAAGDADNAAVANSDETNASNQVSAASIAADVTNDTAAASAIAQDIEALPLPLGWNTDSAKALGRQWKADPASAFGKGLLLLAGWLMTAFAVALGAPFWFDALQKVINLRSAGPRPATSSNADSPAS